MVSCLCSLVQLCCWEGRVLQTNITGVCGDCSQCLGHTGFAPAHGMCFSSLHCLGFRLLCKEWALGCVQFPGLSLSGSGSRVLHKGTDSVGPAFCALPGPSSSGDQVLGECTLLKCRASYHLPVPASWFPGAPISSVLCVSSQELISGCDPPGRCQLSRISGRLLLETGSLFAVW